MYYYKEFLYYENTIQNLQDSVSFIGFEHNKALQQYISLRL